MQSRTSKSSPNSTQTPREVVEALSILRDFLSAAPSQIPPQIIVKANGKKRAYGRASLSAMGYDTAISLFIEHFALDADWLLTPDGGRYPPVVLVFATFCRTHGVTDQGSVLLDASGWEELIQNVEKIRLTFIVRSINVSMMPA